MESPSVNAGALRKNAVGMWSIVFFVLATNGPLTGLIGAVPTAIQMGNGIGIPGTFLVVGLAYLLFAVGFVAMGRHIRNAGAFYAYVSTGLGRPLGTASAFLAIVAYAGMQVACYALIGFFSAESLAHLGLPVPWWAVSIVIAVLVQFFGTRNVEFNGRFLGILMLAEMAVIVVFDAAVVYHGGGPSGYSVASFEPSNVFVPGFGAALVFVGAAFMGFETTAIYAEEARNPARTLPRATYVALLIIMGFFAVSSWLLVVAVGPDQIVAGVTQDAGGIWFALATKLVGPGLADAMNILLITSLFAVLLSFHNSLSRYLFAMGREGILWHRFARTHQAHQTPYVASACQTLFCVVVLVVFGALHVDPMTQVLPISSAPATIGIVSVQLLTSMAVIRFFHRESHGANLWQRLLAPAASAIALACGLIVIVTNMPLLTGGESVFNEAIPLGMLAVGVVGLLTAWWFKLARPELYRNLSRILHEV